MANFLNMPSSSSFTLFGSKFLILDSKKNVNKLTAPITVNNLTSPTFPNGFETLATDTNPIRSGYTAFYNGGSYKLTANNTCSNPAIITVWVLTPRRPMEDITATTAQQTLMPLQMSARDKHTEALVNTLHSTAIWPNPTLADAHTTTKLISDDVDVISNNRIREAIYHLLDQVLEIGRHFYVTCLVTNHLPSNRSETRR